MPARQGDLRTAWRTFSWMMSRTKAQITSAEATMAFRDTSPHAG
jgi:hypothetical protein